jgi:hypothetical protein
MDQERVGVKIEFLRWVNFEHKLSEFSLIN